MPHLQEIFEAARLPLSAIGFTIGGTFLTKWAHSAAPSDLAISFSAYAAANLIFSGVLARDGLAVGIALSSCAGIILASLSAVIFLGEKLSTSQIAGVILSVLGIALFSLPAMGQTP